VTAGGGPGDGGVARRGRALLEQRRAERRRRGLRWALALVAAAVVFVLGVSFGRALEQAPRPGGSETRVRTLEPGTLPATTRTVTVTDSGG
jgi:ferric-dicitrate binding protein FerR (iron transport regulator)